MKSRFRFRPIDWIVVLVIVVFAGYKGMNRPAKVASDRSAFARQLNLEPLYRAAVQADGRLRSFESHAKSYMGYISGPRSIDGQTNGFTYLDFVFRPERYADLDDIYVKNKNVRAELIAVVKELPGVDEARAAAMFKSGLISPRLLRTPRATALLQKLGQDLIRTSKSVDAIQSALSVSDPRFLQDHLRLVAPPSGKRTDPWLPISAFSGSSGMPSDSAHVGLMSAGPIPDLDPLLQKSIAAAWTQLGDAWRGEDAAQANDAIARLASLARTVSPALYPASGRLNMESWYFRHHSMTWVWLLYLVAVVPLLMSVIYKWDGARKIGMVLFVLAFAGHTASLGVRWYISGRWPNSNMFEAVTTAAWFGGVGAMILEWVVRRTPFRNLFALGSAVMSMAALMAAYFLPAQLDSGINNKMAALNDVWLYIHTNMIIWGYAVVGLACVPAMLQLRHRWCDHWDAGMIPKARLFVLPFAVVALNYAGYRLLMHALDDPARELSPQQFMVTVVVFAASLTLVVLELLAARARRLAGIRVERAASGGASALIMGSGGGSAFLKDDGPTAGQVFDGATMVLVELAFIMLWTGIVMGAVWADHSWGRPWGWDPKEVFALNTFIIFLVLIHVRLKVKDRAFWTAVLAVVGFEVMMFNWIVVNFVISGLHSYA